jgi:hypothetical protein
MEELRKPLLYDDVHEDAVVNARDELDFEHHNRDFDENYEVEDVRAVWLVCSAQMEAVEETTRSEWSSSWLWSIFFGSLLPILLYIQFYTVYHLTTSMSDPLPDWISVQGSIFLFVITTILYRQSASFTSTEGGENTWTSVFLFLLPDIMIDILLLLLLLRLMNVAVMTMQVCTILLAVCSILNSCTCSIRVSTASRTSTEEHDELDRLVNLAGRDHDTTLAVVV